MGASGEAASNFTVSPTFLGHHPPGHQRDHFHAFPNVRYGPGGLGWVSGAHLLQILVLLCAVSAWLSHSVPPLQLNSSVESPIPGGEGGLHLPRLPPTVKEQAGQEGEDPRGPARESHPPRVFEVGLLP